jgi:hypothetical protein
MSLPMDIGTGCGLAGATGVRPFLPPLLAGALARGDDGINFSHTPYSFLETPGFLAAVFALAVLAYVLERLEVPRRALALGVGALGLALGALLCAGSVAQAHHASWWGLPVGVLCAALGFGALALLFGRARGRVAGTARALIDAYAEGIALVLAGLSIVAAPVGYVAIVAFAVLLLRTRQQGGQKYEGLRILR